MSARGGRRWMFIGWAMLFGIMAIGLMFLSEAWGRGGLRGGGRGGGSHFRSSPKPSAPRPSASPRSVSPPRSSGGLHTYPASTRASSPSPSSASQAAPSGSIIRFFWLTLLAVAGCGAVGAGAWWFLSRYDLVALAMAFRRKLHYSGILRQRVDATDFTEPHERREFLLFLADNLDPADSDAGYTAFLPIGVSMGIAGELAGRLDLDHQRLLRFTGATPPPEAPSDTPEEADVGCCVLSVVASVRRLSALQVRLGKRIQGGLPPHQALAALATLHFPAIDALYLTFVPDEREQMTKWGATQACRGLEHGDRGMTIEKLRALPPPTNETAAPAREPLPTASAPGA